MGGYSNETNEGEEREGGEKREQMNSKDLSHYRINILIHIRGALPLESTSILQQLGQRSRNGLKVRVATNVLLLDEDVGHGALFGNLLESTLDSSAVICDFANKHDSLAFDRQDERKKFIGKKKRPVSEQVLVVKSTT